MSNHEAPCKAFLPQIDKVKMGVECNADGRAVREYIRQRLWECGERPYKNKGRLMCKLHNEAGTAHLMVVQDEAYISIEGSLQKWYGCKDEYQRYSLPREKICVVVREVLDMLGLPYNEVKVHSVEMGIDMLVLGKITDYTPYLRTAPRQKRMHVPNARTTHYQGSANKVLKVYDKGAEMKIKTPDGTTLLRLELTLRGGASKVKSQLKMTATPKASDLWLYDMGMSLIKKLRKMIHEILPTSKPRTTGAIKDASIDVAMSLLIEEFGAKAVAMVVDRLECEAVAERNGKYRQRIREQAKKIQEQYRELETEYLELMRMEVDRACDEYEAQTDSEDDGDRTRIDSDTINGTENIKA